MPVKGGQFTQQEADFIGRCADLGDPVKAAELAGYARPSTSAVQLSHRPEIQAAVQAATLAKLRVHGASLGVKTLIDIAGDEKAPKAPRVQAAKALLDLNREANASAGSGGSLSDMTRAELDEARALAIAYLQSLDRPPVLDLVASPVPDEAGPGLFD
jgi:hypothetical protein